VFTPSPVRAADVAVTFDDQSQRGAFQLPALVDACVASLSLRSDPTPCKTVSAGMVALVNMIRTAQEKAAADKAAAEKAAAEKAAADAKAKADEKPADQSN
jgi:hypothetical protein